MLINDFFDFSSGCCPLIRSFEYLQNFLSHRCLIRSTQMNNICLWNNLWSSLCSNCFFLYFIQSFSFWIRFLRVLKYSLMILGILTSFQARNRLCQWEKLVEQFQIYETVQAIKRERTSEKQQKKHKKHFCMASEYKFFESEWIKSHTNRYWRFSCSFACLLNFNFRFSLFLIIFE